MRSLRMLSVLFLAALLGGCASGGSKVRPLGPQDLDEIRQKALAEPSNPYWPYRLAQGHEANGDLPAAETELKAALTREPGHAPSVSLLSKVYYDGARHEEAVQLLEAQRANGPFPQELALALALHYEALGYIEESDALAGQLERNVGDWKEHGSALAFLRLRGDQFQHSLEVAERALSAESNAVNHNNLGIALLYAGKPEAARKSFLTSKKLDPKLPGPLYNLAIVDWFYFFDAAGARKWFHKHQELSNEDPDGLAEILSAQASEETR